MWKANGKNYHITTFPGQSLSKTGLSLEEAMDLSRDRQIEEEMMLLHRRCSYSVEGTGLSVLLRGVFWQVCVENVVDLLAVKYYDVLGAVYVLYARV
jgi:hypothetical protein